MNGEKMLEILREQKKKRIKMKIKPFFSKAYRKMIVEINENFSINMFKTKVSNHFKTSRRKWF